jgi:four helix bundle protein
MKNYNEKLKADLKGRAYQYALKIIEFIDNLPRDISTRIIPGQLLRSATSIGANIIEAQASSSKREFINFFHHSLKSANESNFWLGLLKDANKANGEEVEILLKETTELGNILGSSLLTLKGKK